MGLTQCGILFGVSDSHKGWCYKNSSHSPYVLTEQNVRKEQISLALLWEPLELIIVAHLCPVCPNMVYLGQSVLS